ncbi:MAG: HAD-IB family hydrolase [Tissierellia bacterium]|nr:HAD-IB family hydrolase [Tissierellia bacterium]
MGKIAAFFDIDGTIYRESLMIRHFEKLMNYEVIPRKIWFTEVEDLYTEWKKRYGDYEEYLELLAHVYLEHLKGIDKDFVNYIADHTISDSGEYIFKYSRDQLLWHREMGHLIFFVSGSPDFLVSRMANMYKATDWRGTEYKVDEENKITGEIVPMWGSDSKNHAIAELVKLYDVDVENSYAYGDTTGDFSMLSLMGNPIAINPNEALLELIKTDKRLSDRASIIIERKNVIYKVKSDVETL